MKNIRVYIGIDDTDNKESRGTGYRARKMATLLKNKGLGTINGITRHQLFVHPDIPYTSQNSSACLEIETDNLETLKIFSRDFLLEDSAEGSDVGLCIAKENQIKKEIIIWGENAKNTILTKKEAYILAERNNIFLEGLTGTKDGIIGALA